MSGENGQGWITEDAFFTVSPGARQVRQRKVVKMNQVSLAEKRVPKEHGGDTRWARTWKPDDSKPSRRRAKARS